MNNYELTIILDPEYKDSEKTVAKVKEWIEAAKGKITKTDKLGVKDFSYKIKKLTKGSYYFFNFSCDPANTPSIERKLTLETSLVRYLLIRV